MAATAIEENVAPAAEQAPAEGAAPAAADPADESYDESLLIKVKGKVKRPSRPDDTERNLQVQKLQEQIDRATARIKEIKAILDARAAGRTVSPEQQAIRQRLQQLRGEFDAVLLQKKRLLIQNDEKKTERDKLFAEQRAIRDSIKGPVNLQAIEQRLGELEVKLNHESLSAAQEKAAREQKDRLEKTDKPAALRLAAVSAQIDELKASGEGVRAEIAALNAQLDKIKAAREVEDAKLAEQRAAEQEARSDIPALNVEKKELWEVIQALRDKQREIRQAFNAQWDEFKKLDKAWKGWFAQERKRRNEQRKKEYEERQEARKARDGEVEKPAKFVMEVFTCEQVLSYLRQFVSAEKGEVEEKKEVEAPAPGMKLLQRAPDKDEDKLFTSMGGKKGRGARKAAEKQQKAETVRTLPRILPLETLKTFHTLGLDPPKTNEDVPAAIAAVEAKKKEYEAKRDKAAAEPEPEPAEEEAEEAAAGDANGDDAKEGEGEEGGAAAAAAGAAAAAVVAEANGDADADEEEADGDADEEEVAKADAEEEEAKGAAKSDDGLGVKLRVTDDGEVNLELAV